MERIIMQINEYKLALYRLSASFFSSFSASALTNPYQTIHNLVAILSFSNNNHTMFVVGMQTHDLLKNCFLCHKSLLPELPLTKHSFDAMTCI